MLLSLLKFLNILSQQKIKRKALTLNLAYFLFFTEVLREKYENPQSFFIFLANFFALW